MSPEEIREWQLRNPEPLCQECRKVKADVVYFVPPNDYIGERIVPMCQGCLDNFDEIILGMAGGMRQLVGDVGSDE
jgi:hypothetical protein